MSNDKVVEGNADKQPLRDYADKRVDDSDLRKYQKQIQKAKKLGLYEL